MSHLTPCNYCTLRRMRLRGEVIVEKITDPADPMEGWMSATYAGEEKPSAWFMVLTEECVC